MKKSICILLSLIFLTSILSACTDGGSESSVASEQTSDNVFDDSSELSSDTSSDISQVESEKINMYVQPIASDHLLYDIVEEERIYSGALTTEEKQEEVDIKPINNIIENFLGYSETLEYSETRRVARRDIIVHRYISDNIIADIDAETNQIQSMVFSDYPEGYALSTERTDLVTAKQNAIDFINKHFSNSINLSEFSEVEVGETSYHKYKIRCKKYARGICVELIDINVDEYGNIYAFYHDRKTNNVDLIPQYTEEEYLETIRKELQALYDKLPEESRGTIGNVGFESGLLSSSTTIEYSHKMDLYLISCTVKYTLDDYPEETITVYLPYAKGSDVKQ